MVLAVLGTGTSTDAELFSDLETVSALWASPVSSVGKERHPHFTPPGRIFQRLWGLNPCNVMGDPWQLGLEKMGE